MPPLTFGIMVAGTVSGWVITRTGRYKPFAVAGLGLMTAATFALAAIGVGTPLTVIMVIGLGSSMQTLTLAAANDVDVLHIGVATSASTFSRQIGGRVGARCPCRSCSARSATGSPPPWARLPRRPPTVRRSRGTRRWRRTGRWTSTTRPSSPPSTPCWRPILDGFASSMRLVFLIGGIVVTISFVLVWFPREKPLAETSAPEQLEEEDAAARRPQST
ncbi:hypothetical protein [Amycolatopsis sp. NPDC051903]|uniref:hypothetical protein n=1 Tax=Amycolatopsis sp. NPDC051903 TaxID=3363936 RepID=UPI0037A36609